MNPRRAFHPDLAGAVLEGRLLLAASPTASHSAQAASQPRTLPAAQVERSKPTPPPPDQPFILMLPPTDPSTPIGRLSGGAGPGGGGPGAGPASSAFGSGSGSGAVASVASGGRGARPASGSGGAGVTLGSVVSAAGRTPMFSRKTVVRVAAVNSGTKSLNTVETTASEATAQQSSPGEGSGPQAAATAGGSPSNAVPFASQGLGLGEFPRPLAPLPNLVPTLAPAP